MRFGPLGKRQLQQATTWLYSAGTFGAASGLAVLYFTEWKAVLQYAPFYGSKFVKPDEE